MLVETSRDGETWVTLGLWSPTSTGQDLENEYSARVAVVVGSEQDARFIRYSLALPPRLGEVTLPCLLSALSARGPSNENGATAPAAAVMAEGFQSDKGLPFPAMTTDSRHLILVHAASEGGGNTAEAGEEAKVEENKRRW